MPLLEQEPVITVVEKQKRAEFLSKLGNYKHFLKLTTTQNIQM
jgi:hypothetical protein